MNYNMKIFTNISKYTIYSISITTILILLVAIVFNVFPMLIPENESNLQDVYIDTDKNTAQLNDGNIEYTIDGKVIVNTGERNIPNHEVYNPIEKTLTQASPEDTGKLIHYKNQYKNGYRQGRYMQMRPELNIPVEAGTFEHWRYDHAKQYFTGYYNKKIIGYLGADGFKENNSSIKPFSINDINVWYEDEVYRKSSDNNELVKHKSLSFCMLSKQDDGLYLTHFRDKTHKRIVSFEDIPKISGWTVSSWNGRTTAEDDSGIITLTYDDKSPELLLRRYGYKKVQTNITDIDFEDYNFSLWDNNNNLEKIYLVAKEKPYRQFRDLPTRDREEKTYQHSEKTGITTNIYYKYQVQFYEVDLDNGNTNKIAEHELAKTEVYPQIIIDRMKYWSMMDDIVAVIAPMALKWTVDTEPIKTLLYHTMGTYTFSRLYLYAMILTVLSIAVMLWHIKNRRQSYLEVGGWVLFIFLFNISGLLTYLIFNCCPVAKCHACGKDRHLKSNFCPHCNATLPKPEHNPTDIIRAGAA